MEVAIYKGEDVICIGTIEECAKHRGVQPETIKYYLTGAYKNKISRRKNPRNYITAIVLDDED